MVVFENTENGRPAPSSSGAKGCIEAGAGGHHTEDGGTCLSRALAEVIGVVDKIFYLLGLRIAQNPWKTLTMCLSCVLLCCFGFAKFTSVTRAEDLWAPSSSLSINHEETILSYFDDEDFSVFVLENPEEGGSVLTTEYMDTFWEIHAKILEVETSEGNTFADLCSKDVDGFACSQPRGGVGRFWGNNFGTYSATVGSDSDILAAINVEKFPDGAPVNLAAVFGNSVTLDNDSMVTAAKAMVQSYELVMSPVDDARSGEVMEWERAMQETMADAADELDFLNLVYSTSRSIDDALEESISAEIYLFIATCVIMVAVVIASLGRFRMGSVERRSCLGVGGVGIVMAGGLAAFGICSAFGVPFTALSHILPFILVAIGVDDMFIILAAYDLTDPYAPVEERTALGLKRCGVSITYTSLASFCAFILGSRTTLPAVEYACIYAATAITVGFLLQVTAFPAFLTLDARRQAAGRLDWCCCLTDKQGSESVATGVSPPDAMSAASPESSPEGTPVCTGLNAHTASKEKKEEDGGIERVDPTAANDREDPSSDSVGSVRFPAVDRKRHKAALATAVPSTVIEGPNIHDGLGRDVNGRKKTMARGPAAAMTDSNGKRLDRSPGGSRELTAVGRWMRDTYTPLLLSDNGKVFVLLSAAGLFVAGIYGVTQTTRGFFNPLDLARNDHFARDYAKLAMRYDVDYYQLLPLSVYVGDVDYSNTSVQAIIEETNTAMTSQEFISGPVDSWLVAFTEWTSTSDVYENKTSEARGYVVYDDISSFYQALWAFLNTSSNERFLANLAFDAHGRIEMSRTDMVLAYLSSDAEAVESMQEARAVMRAVALEPKAFSFSPTFFASEQVLVIYNELIANSLLALAVIAVLSLFVLRSISAVLLVCTTVVVIDIEVLGFIHFWGMEVNAITAIAVITAVGLMVDYLFHIVCCYLRQTPGGTKAARIADALGEMGPPVIACAATTFLGIIPMAFAQEAAFWAIFKMFVSIVVFGLYHGVAFIPVFLSFLPEGTCWPRWRTKGVSCSPEIVDVTGKSADAEECGRLKAKNRSVPTNRASGKTPALKRSCSAVTFGGITDASVSTAQYDHGPPPERYFLRSSCRKVQPGNAPGDGHSFLDTQELAGKRKVLPSGDGCSLSDFSDDASSLVGGSLLTGSSSLRGTSLVAGGSFLGDGSVLGGGSFLGAGGGSGSLLGSSPLDLGGMFGLLPERKPRDAVASAPTPTTASTTKGAEEGEVHAEEKIPDRSSCEEKMPDSYILDSEIDDDTEDDAEIIRSPASWQKAGAASVEAPEPHPFAAPRPIPRSHSTVRSSASWIGTSSKAVEPHPSVAPWLLPKAHSDVGSPTSWYEDHPKSPEPHPFAARRPMPNSHFVVGDPASWYEDNPKALEPCPIVAPRPPPQSNVRVASWQEDSPKMWRSPRVGEKGPENGGEVQMPRKSPWKEADPNALQPDPAVAPRPQRCSLVRATSWEEVDSKIWPAPNVGKEVPEHDGGKVQTRRKSSPDSRVRLWEKDTYSVETTAKHARSMEAGATSRPKIWPSPRGNGKGVPESDEEVQMWKSSPGSRGGLEKKDIYSVQITEEHTEPLKAVETSRPKIWSSPRVAGKDDPQFSGEVQMPWKAPSGRFAKDMYSVQATADHTGPLEAGETSQPKIWPSPRVSRKHDLEAGGKVPMWNSSPGRFGKDMYSVQAAERQAQEAAMLPKMWSSPTVTKDEPEESDKEAQIWKSSPGKFGKEIFSAQAAAEFALPEEGGEEVLGPKMWRTPRGKGKDGPKSVGGIQVWKSSPAKVGKEMVSVKTAGLLESREVSDPKMWHPTKKNGKDEPQSGRGRQTWNSSPGVSQKKETLSVEATAECAGPKAVEASGPKMWKPSPVVSVAPTAAAF